MDLPTKPPLDDGEGLSLRDVEGCIWYVWQLTLQDMEAYPAPADLMPVNVKDSYPPRPWAAGSGGGSVVAFFRDIQETLEKYTEFRADLDHNSLVTAYDEDQTWGQYADHVWNNTIDIEGLGDRP